MARTPGPLLSLLQKHRVIRRLAALGGAAIGLYFLGAKLGWWDRFWL